MLRSYYINMDPAYSDMPAASRSAEAPGAMLGTPYQTKLTFLANLLTILRILLQWKLDYDNSFASCAMHHVVAPLLRTGPSPARGPPMAHGWSAS